jgi:hypothetical protein
MGSLEGKLYNSSRCVPPFPPVYDDPPCLFGSSRILCKLIDPHRIRILSQIVAQTNNMSQASPDDSRATSYQGTDDLGRVTLAMSRMTEQLKTIAEGYSQEAYYLSVRDALKFFSDKDEEMNPIELEKALPLDRNKQYNANSWTEIGNFFLQQCGLPTTGGWDALAGKVIYNTRSASNRKHQARSAVKTWLARRTDLFHTGKAEDYFSMERNKSDLESVSGPSHSERTASSASISQIQSVL